VLETLLDKIQKVTVWVLAGRFDVIVLPPQPTWASCSPKKYRSHPGFLSQYRACLEVFEYFLLVLIGAEFLEALKAYMKKDVLHVRIVLEVALIAWRGKPSSKSRTPCRA
jgi:hypothetical protein